MKLFICHASEDKSDFVQPLAEALSREFDVWYDKFVLTLGDSLLRKIDEGLASCDFGVVVLSYAFFSRKWPQAELDGLFARETLSRKIILPIWKGVTRDDVERFSPILAMRVAVASSEGVDAVVAEVKRAVQVSERTRELSNFESSIARAKKRVQTVEEKRESGRILDSEAGVLAIKNQLDSVIATLTRCLSELADGSDFFRFTVNRRGSYPIYFRGPFRLGLSITLKEQAANTARRVRLYAVIHQAPDNFEDEKQPELLKEFDFKPVFRSPSQLAWVVEEGGQEYSADELAGLLLETLTEEIEKEA